MTSLTLIKGFNNPIHDSQVVFRQLLKAMSEPGTLKSVRSPESIETLYTSTFAVCQALMDQQTPLWLSPNFDTPNIKHNLHFHTGVPITEQHQDALFALVDATVIDTLDVFSQKESTDVTKDFFLDKSKGFSQGNSEYPEMGCTLIIQVSSIKDSLSDTTNLRLTGPGIESQHIVSISDLSPRLLDYLSNETGERNAAFPLGLDFIFIDHNQIVCLPRTTNVEVL
jgi:alpha-D-ribose 1-methylphosphonate 5-triphosphate synthase subunit PhnH